MAESPLVVLARARFDQAAEAEAAQRKRELEALKFYEDDQWPADVRADRSGQQSSNRLPPVPPRPCLTINKIKQPVRQVLNQERNADMGVELVPADDFGLEGVQPISDEEIELREGLIRRIQRHSHAQSARSWGFSRAVIAGRGFWRVSTQYVSPKSDDQEIVIQRIWNQANVMLDPAHEEPDGSDARWAFVFTDMSFEAFKSEFPESQVATRYSDDADWRTLMQDASPWFRETEKVKFVRVAEYFYEVLKPIKTESGRDTTERTIKWAKINGQEVLDETDWPGRFIPIVKVVGEELQPFDGDRREIGMVETSMDSQRGFNYMVSAMVESIGLAPRAPWVGAEGQFEGHEMEFQLANSRNIPYLQYKPTTVSGETLPPPMRQSVEPPIQAIAMAIGQFSQGIHDTTGIPSSSLGEVDPTIKSGRAILALQKQTEHGTSDYLHNMARSMTYEGRIVNDLLPKIYDRQGRLAQIIKGDTDPETVMIGQPFVMQKGRPMVAPPGAPNATTYKLTPDTDWTIAVKVGKAYDTRREQESASMGEILTSQPGLFPAYADLFFAAQDWPGSQQMKERARMMLPPQILQQLDAKEQGQQPIPPQVQAQMQALGQQNQAMAKELEAKTQFIQTEQVKAQSQAMIQQMKIAADERMDARDNQVKLAIASMQAQMEQQTLILKEALAATREGIHQTKEQAHQRAMAETDAALEVGHAEAGREFDAAQREQDRVLQSSEAEMGRQHEQTLAEQAQSAQNSDQS